MQYFSEKRNYPKSAVGSGIMRNLYFSSLYFKLFLGGVLTVLALSLYFAMPLLKGWGELDQLERRCSELPVLARVIRFVYQELGSIPRILELPSVLGETALPLDGG